MATLPATAPAANEQPIALTPEAEKFALMQRQAALFASSPLIPQHLRNGTPQQAMANCYIAMTIADRMGEDRMTVMQNIHIVHGTAGFKAQYMIARANASGVFKDGIDWTIEGKGKDLSVTAFATLAATGRRVSITVDMTMAEAEGWTKNSKYKTMPEIMLRYRSGTFLVRMYAPQVMLGYQTVEEHEDLVAAVAPTAPPITGQALLEQARADEPAPSPATDDAPSAAEAAPQPAPEVAADAEQEAPAKPPLHERMKAAAEKRGDADMGEKPTLDQAKAEIEGCELVADINARVRMFQGQLSDEDQAVLESFALDRVEAVSRKGG